MQIAYCKLHSIVDNGAWCERQIICQKLIKKFVVATNVYEVLILTKMKMKIIYKLNISKRFCY